jgi:hypothetical protein
VTKIEIGPAADAAARGVQNGDHARSMKYK